jgi:ribosomal protein S18 acetylase RimI-like enzyme
VRLDRRRLLQRLEAQFAAAVARGSEVRDAPGYRVHLWPTPEPFYRNVAMPIDAAAASVDAVAAMARLFVERDRHPRLEFFAELWPAVPNALEAAGFLLEREARVMTRAVSGLGHASSGPAPVLLDAAIPRSSLAEYLEAAASAFDEAIMLASGEVDGLARGLRDGTIVAAVVLVDGAPVAGASLVRAGEVGELIGVWCRPDRRRQGLATAVSRVVLDRFHADGGDLAWLSSTDGASEALYRALGFVRCGTQLNYAGPALALT